MVLVRKLLDEDSYTMGDLVNLLGTHSRSSICNGDDEEEDDDDLEATKLRCNT